MPRTRSSVAILLSALAVLLGGPLATLAFGPVSVRGDWASATHRSAGLAPDPAEHRGAIVQVYAARTFGWRGAFAVHTWLAAKPAGAPAYTRYEVIGWRARLGGSGLTVHSGRAPDAEWYGAAPQLLRDLRGEQAEAVIARLDAVAAAYPFESYRAWPGPNSNTFVAFVAREIPQLRVALPPHAVGKDFLPHGRVVARTPSGTGWQASLGGLLGLAVALDEGLEVNLLGLVTGVDVAPPALKLPGVGRLPASRI
ncbi:MAG: DUF3750 domain-containing protein [Betaproteobacteria bacterium]|nr:DUF3750 domain-containing protein [Betaproteobacteria bacterium]MDH5285057.1 DUF3750 domain-containing protein [Betaproteobacteria bacterium]